MMENTDQENIDHIKAAKLDDHMGNGIGFGQNLIPTEEFSTSQLIIQP